MSIPVLPPIQLDGIDFRFNEMKASQYGGLTNFCGWKEILLRQSGGRRDVMLPPNTKSIVGTVAHNVLEQVLRGNICDAAGFDEAWAQQLASRLEKLQTDYPWLKVQTPLEDYEKKYRTKLMAERVWQRRSSRQGTTTVPEGEYKIPGLTGRIDLVIRRDQWTAIVDYKTGTITTGNGEIKPAFVIQLKLYALLYQKQTGQIVSKLNLLNLADERFEVPFTQEELEPLYEQVLAKSASLNEFIDAGDFSALANLEEETCRFCQLRPLCDHYWQSAIKNTSDFEGSFREVKEAFDKSLLLVFDVAGERRLLRGLQGWTMDDFAGKEGMSLRVLNAWPSDKPEMTHLYNATANTALFWSNA
ncbi:MAG: PD-(D/E)XK nuclease family protein [Bacteroidetes bacterium]|nr:PD-(D/E)XK nuclease family protein [Bacteroidota bacterium]